MNFAQQQAQVQISSTPDAADIEIDGKYFGSTPSTVSVPAGEHQISVKKTGFKPWQRKITVSTGQVERECRPGSRTEVGTTLPISPVILLRLMLAERSVLRQDARRSRHGWLSRLDAKPSV
jgi:hypothetical protein